MRHIGSGGFQSAEKKQLKITSSLGTICFSHNIKEAVPAELDMILFFRRIEIRRY